MPDIHERLRMLSREPVTARVAVLAGALRHAAPDERVAICSALLETGHAAGLKAVLKVLPRLDAASRARLIAAGDGLADAVVDVLAQASRATVLDTIEFIAERGRADLAHTLVGALQSPLEGVPDAAASGLRRLAECVYGADGARSHARERAKLDGAIGAAAAGYTVHRSRDVIVALALASGAPGRVVGGVLGDDEHPAALALRGLILRGGEAIVPRLLLRWLGRDETRRPAGRRLHRVIRDGRLATVMEQGHLLRTPRSRDGLRSVDRPLQCAPDTRTIATLPPAQQRFAAELVDALPLRSAHRTEILGRALSPNVTPLARVHAVRTLRRYETRSVTAALERAADDADASVRHAATAVLDTRATPPTDLRRAVRRDAATLHASWRDVGDLDRLAAARHLARRALPELLGIFELQLEDDERDVRLQTLALVRRLHVADRLDEPLARLAFDVDLHIASAATAALGAVDSPRAREVVRRHLMHDDDRVRANAIESLEGARDGAALAAPHLDDDANRARANAIRVVSRERLIEAVAPLRRMLGDERPMHRASAIWVARTARCRRVLGDLDRLASDDAQPALRTRAAAAAQLLRSCRPEEVLA